MTELRTEAERLRAQLEAESVLYYALRDERDALVREVARLRALPEAWTLAAAEQQSIAAGEVPELPRDLALVARGRARQLEDCAAELVAALNTEVTG